MSRRDPSSRKPFAIVLGMPENVDVSVDATTIAHRELGTMLFRKELSLAPAESHAGGKCVKAFFN